MAQRVVLLPGFKSTVVYIESQQSIHDEIVGPILRLHVTVRMSNNRAGLGQIPWVIYCLPVAGFANSHTFIILTNTCFCSNALAICIIV